MSDSPELTVVHETMTLVENSPTTFGRFKRHYSIPGCAPLSATCSMSQSGLWEVTVKVLRADGSQAEVLAETVSAQTDNGEEVCDRLAVVAARLLIEAKEAGR